MQITLKEDFVKAFTPTVKASFPILAKRMDEKISRYGENTCTLNMRAADSGEFDEGLSGEHLENLLYDFAKKHKVQAVMMHISSVRIVTSGLDSKPPGSLEALKVGLIEYLKKDAIDGWIYKKVGDKYLPFVVTRVIHEQVTKREREEGHKAYVRLSFTANSTANTVRRSDTSYRSRGSSEEHDGERWEWGDFNKKTIPQIMAEQDLFHETAELKENYLRQLALYDKYRPLFAQQFVIDPGSLITEFDPENKHTGHENRRVVVPTKFINDDMSVKRSFVETRDNRFWLQEGITDHSLFEKMPVHTYLRMFNLTSHNFAYIHTEEIKPYIYNRGLADKIVLPESHRDLIGVLTEDLDAVRGDVIEGKSGGVSILCKGRPGLGKTLTPEIYSEVKGKPLYRVHSGQLGTKPEQVEASLKLIFGRAEQWQCILLLDEADVYIRRRGDDLHHNAVVACFLRTMEYFGGIFFMTTNRSDDVDDAIVSRCIAVINYEMPNDDDLGRIFAIQSEALGSGLTHPDINTLVKTYSGRLSGRDVKELLKLATKYSLAHGKERVEADTVRKLAQFKGF